MAKTASNYEIVFGSDVPDPDYLPRGAAEDFIYSHDHEVIISGAAECLGGEVEIYDPETGLSHSIEYLYKNKIRPTVLTLNGIKKAEVPFIKGYAPLYKITLENGFSFTATKKHKILTSRGWLFVDSVSVGESLQGCVPSRLASTLESCQVESFQDVYRYSQIPLDSSRRCSACSRQCDEQPRFSINNAQAFFQPRVDVPERIRDDHNLDGLAFLSERNHLHQFAVHPSIARSSHPCLTSKICGAGFYSFQDIEEHEFDSFQLGGRSLKEKYLHPSRVQAIDHDSVRKQLFSFDSPLLDYTVFSSTVVSIEYERTDYFYDLTVPGAGHYLANGVWHHNTGKTIAACWKAHLICLKYPGVQGSLVRKTYASITGTVFQTYKRIIKDAPVTIRGGEHKPDKLIYSNGSVVWIGGLDKPDKILSGERDFIQVCQAEELTLEDWEIMTSRTTGRSSVYPFTQVFGDCNPGRSKHWILERQKAGALKLLKSRHEDNPTLYTANGQLTEQGKKTMKILDSLTGVRYKRLRLGIWATAEGAVFDTFDPDVHVKKQNIGNYKNFRLAMDEGYTNPAVILVIGEDNDGRRHIFEEFYERGKLESEVVKKAVELGVKYGTKNVTVDHAAAGLIAALRDAGLNTQGGKGGIFEGIQKIQNDLKVQPDKRPRLTIDPDCTNTINDMESYEWKPEKDEPKKENDHSPDAIRYDYDVYDTHTQGGGFYFR